MKSNNIPFDIKRKSIKEAQTEIKEIISLLEKKETNLEESLDKYNRMLYLNIHIQEEFKDRASKIKEENLKKNKSSLLKDL